MGIGLWVLGLVVVAPWSALSVLIEIAVLSFGLGFRGFLQKLSEQFLVDALKRLRNELRLVPASVRLKTHLSQERFPGPVQGSASVLAMDRMDSNEGKLLFE